MTEEVDAGQNDTDASGEATQTEVTGFNGTILGGEEGDQSSESANELPSGEPGDEVDNDKPDETSDKLDDQGNDIPESYELKMPEGMDFFDEDSAASAGELFKELGLSQDQADKVTDLIASNLSRLGETAENDFRDQQNAWSEELSKDTEFGGEAFEENKGKVAEFLKKTVPNDIRTDLFGMLDSTGAGNFPALVKYIHHLSRSFPVGEDNPGSGDAAISKSTAAARLYAADGGKK